MPMYEESKYRRSPQRTAGPRASHHGSTRTSLANNDFVSLLSGSCDAHRDLYRSAGVRAFHSSLYEADSEQQVVGEFSLFCTRERCTRMQARMVVVCGQVAGERSCVPFDSESSAKFEGVRLKIPSSSNFIHATSSWHGNISIGNDT